MRVMMLMIPRVYQPETPAAERAGEGFVPPADAVATMTKFNEELAEAGVLVALEGLHPTTRAARVSFAKGRPRVSDGPFTEARDVIGGYWIVDVPSLAEAVGWARRCPAADGDVIEVRQVFAEEDFPEAVRRAADSPDVRAAVAG